MHTKLLFLIFGVIVFFKSSCSIKYGQYISKEYTNLSNSTCEVKAENVLFYFENEKVGLIEVAGAKYSNYEKLINHLKYQAWNNCADGVINIKISYKDRAVGRTFNSSEEMKYTSTVLTGITEILNDTISVGENKEFIEKVRKDIKEENLI